jgi:hypothetical protein
MCGMVDTDEPGWKDTTPGITDYDGGTDYTGAYLSPTYDLGAKVVFSLRVMSAYEALIHDTTDSSIGSRTDRTYPRDTDLAITSNATQKISAAFSDDDIAWTGWQEIRGVIQAEAQHFKIKAECFLDMAYGGFEWTALAHQADVPEKTLRLFNQAISIGGTTFTLAGLGLTILKEYFVGVTVHGTSIQQRWRGGRKRRHRYKGVLKWHKLMMQQNRYPERRPSENYTRSSESISPPSYPVFPAHRSHPARSPGRSAGGQTVGHTDMPMSIPETSESVRAAGSKT